MLVLNRVNSVYFQEHISQVIHINTMHLKQGERRSNYSCMYILVAFVSSTRIPVVIYFHFTSN